MKRKILLLILPFFLSVSSFAKDINAWKSENTIEQQYTVFKKNLNFWNGNYFLNETQLTEFYSALKDSVNALESKIAKRTNTISTLQSELNTTNNQLTNTRAELETSIKSQNAIGVFGQQIDKSIYTLIMSVVILSLLAVSGILYMLFKRSSKVTSRTKEDYEELKQEFEVRKKSALERYTKINMELHQTRLELNQNRF